MTGTGGAGDRGRTGADTGREEVEAEEEVPNDIRGAVPLAWPLLPLVDDMTVATGGVDPALLVVVVRDVRRVERRNESVNVELPVVGSRVRDVIGTLDEDVPFARPNAGEAERVGRWDEREDSTEPSVDEEGWGGRGLADRGMPDGKEGIGRNVGVVGRDCEGWLVDRESVDSRDRGREDEPEPDAWSAVGPLVESGEGILDRDGRSRLNEP